MNKRFQSNRWNLPYPCLSYNEGFIYKITDKETGMFYIGKKSFWRRIKGRSKVQSKWQSYKSSSIPLKKMINKKGVNSFHFEVLRVCNSRRELTYFEIHHQVQHNCILDPKSFNVNLGSTRIRMK